MPEIPQKPRVLHLLGSFNQGGSERQAVQLLRLLSQSGRYDLRLAVIDPAGQLRGEVEEFGLHSVPSFPLTSFYNANMAKQILRFRGFLRDQEIQIVHTHDFYTNVFGAIGAVSARVPALICSRREIGGMRTPAQKWVERRAYNAADAILANAQAVKDALIAEGVSAGKIEILYNGLDFARVRAAGKDRMELLKNLALPADPDLQFVTLIANLRHDVKDHPMFLRAAAVVHRDIPSARFILAGEGELLEPMRKLAADLGLADATIFLGCCNQIAELLAVSNICVLSSKSEGFSNSILEYMAAGKPVVATNVGGAAEAIGENETGFLVRSGDAEAMGARLIELLRNPERARIMGERGKEVVQARFSTQTQLAGAEALYSRLLSR